MNGTLNKVMLIGHLGDDVMIHYWAFSVGHQRDLHQQANQRKDYLYRVA
jgi:hypothetical protein